MKVMTMKPFWHCITVWFLLDSSSQHNICGGEEQLAVDIHPFRGRVMGTKLKTTTPYQADTQYATMSIEVALCCKV